MNIHNFLYLSTLCILALSGPLNIEKLEELANVNHGSLANLAEEIKVVSQMNGLSPEDSLFDALAGDGTEDLSEEIIIPITFDTDDTEDADYNHEGGIKAIHKVKSIQPVKSIKSVNGVREVQSMRNVPDDIARQFIEEHNLMSLTGIGDVGFESEAHASDSHVEGPIAIDPDAADLHTSNSHASNSHASNSHATGSHSKDSHATNSHSTNSHAKPTTSKEEVPFDVFTRLTQFAHDLLDFVDTIRARVPKAGNVLDDDGWNFMREEARWRNEKLREMRGGAESETPELTLQKIKSIQELANVHEIENISPIKSITPIKSIKEVVGLYELTDDQVEALRRLNNGHDYEA